MIDLVQMPLVRSLERSVLSCAHYNLACSVGVFWAGGKLLVDVRTVASAIFVIRAPEENACTAG